MFLILKFEHTQRTYISFVFIIFFFMSVDQLFPTYQNEYSHAIKQNKFEYVQNFETH